MTITADANGVVTGKFTIPAGIRAGAKEVVLNGSGGSRARATFVGQGTLVSQVLQAVTRTTLTYYDPLAQTFTLSDEYQLGGVELFVTAKGATPFTVQIRATQNGVPSQAILGEVTKQPSALTVGAWNRFVFPEPVHALPNVEYAIVAMCQDATGAVAIAELGKWDNANSRWVTSQPYQVGTLLSSSNASTWTPHQDRDLAFRLLARSYSEASKEVDLGTIAVTNATDLVVLSMADNPATGADSEVRLSMPDGSVVSASDGQNIRLPASVTGNIGVKAVLRANQKMGAVLHPGSQVIKGTIKSSAEYVSRAIPADAAGCNVRVIFDAEIPSGSTAKVYIKGVDAGDTWTEVTQTGSAKALGNNLYEYQYYKTSVLESAVQVKIALTGSAAARPYVHNLRVSIT